MMKYLYTTAIALLILTITQAQEGNLVPNPSFEEIDGKIREGGEVYLAKPWKAINMQPVDLYSADAKSDEFGAPENKYGEEKAKTGSNYAGVNFFGYKGRIPRTYLGTTLSEPMKEGVEYCLKFHVSLADRSKYASNNISMYVTSEEVTEMSERNLSFEPQVQSMTNEVFSQQFLWEPICSKYTAKGGEQYIIIGNFKTDEQTTTEALRMSRDFTGRQSYDAYYFIDDVSVIPTEKLGPKDCACDKIAGGQMKVEFKKFGTDESIRSTAKKTVLVNSDGTKASSTIGKESEEATDENEVEAEAPDDQPKSFKSEPVKEEKPKVYTPAQTEIIYGNKLFAAVGNEEKKLDKVVTYLKANPTKKIEIIGHADPSESSVSFIGKRRAFDVKKKLINKGIDESRISYKSMETNDPKDPNDASKNSRVTFAIK